MLISYIDVLPIYSRLLILLIGFLLNQTHFASSTNSCILTAYFRPLMKYFSIWKCARFFQAWSFIPPTLAAYASGQLGKKADSSEALTEELVKIPISFHGLFWGLPWYLHMAIQCSCMPCRGPRGIGGSSRFRPSWLNLSLLQGCSCCACTVGWFHLKRFSDPLLCIAAKMFEPVL